MKNFNSILIIILLSAVITESKGQKQTVNNDIIKVDVTKGYSKKKELILQDFMDVEYIPLETNDVFLHNGLMQDIGKKIMVITYNKNGNIFIYNRSGKALRKINRKGQSGEEYRNLTTIALDEENNEIFVNDYYTGRILVYDLYGKFKRRLKHWEGVNYKFYSYIFNYNKNNLICYDEQNTKTPFLLISKKDGSITKKIEIPFKKKKSLEQISKNGTEYHFMSYASYRPIIPYYGNWILSEPSSDTIYTFSQDYNLRPLLVRTPSIQSMNPEIFLSLNFFSDRYYFLETIKNIYDFKTKSGFPNIFFMYDKQEKAFGGYNVYNGDYTTKREIYMNHLRFSNHHEIESYQPLSSERLIEDYKKGLLKGKLKEIAAKLDEDSNPVIMLIKHKK